MSKRLRITLFGPQGSGKGTQGELLADRFDIPIIGVGELLKAEITARTSLGKVVRTYVDSGTLVPDDLANAILQKRLKKLEGERGFVMDGYPRNVDQAVWLDKTARINLAIHIKISDNESVDRLSGRLQCTECKQTYHVKHSPPIRKGLCAICGGKLVKRSDDTSLVIRKRLETYHFMTEPLVSYYRQRGVLLNINGEQPIPYVFEEIIKKIAKLGFK
ncbi:MAG: nucleoside monophosphate kinase [bacterium]|nr:nucleoside monophosphate kinase [bacterium]